MALSPAATGGLGAMTWPDAAAVSLLAVPLGACEQHGPHLPLSTDTIIAAALARGLAARRRDVTVAPALPYGASGEHAGFPGTISIGLDALRLVLVELVRSADAFAGVVLVSGHGGNTAAVATAVAQLHLEGRRVLGWFPSSTSAARAARRAADAHAGFVETSVLLHLEPEVVRTSRAAPGDLRPLEAVVDELRSGGVAAVSPNGVLGDPADASAAAGRRVLDAWVADLGAAVDRWVAQGVTTPAGSEAG